MRKISKISIISIFIILVCGMIFNVKADQESTNIATYKDEIIRNRC